MICVIIQLESNDIIVVTDVLKFKSTNKNCNLYLKVTK